MNLNKTKIRFQESQVDTRQTKTIFRFEEDDKQNMLEHLRKENYKLELKKLIVEKKEKKKIDQML